MRKAVCRWCERSRPLKKMWVGHWSVQRVCIDRDVCSRFVDAHNARVQKRVRGDVRARFGTAAMHKWAYDCMSSEERASLAAMLKAAYAS